MTRNTYSQQYLKEPVCPRWVGLLQLTAPLARQCRIQHTHAAAAEGQQAHGAVQRLLLLLLLLLVLGAGLCCCLRRW
jgi:hypothetical protein